MFKRIFFMLTFLVLMSGLSFSSQGDMDILDLNAGLVAYYPFNGNANDESGNGNNGTVFGATLTTDRFWNVDSAYSFDGVNNYISIPDTPELSGGYPLDKSVSVWFKVDSMTSYTPIVIKALSTQQVDWRLIIRNGKLTFSSYNSWFISEVFCSQTTSEITNGVWYHGVLVADQSDIYIYVNGNMVGYCHNFGGTTDTTAPVTIGAVPYKNYYYDGKIDDIRIYNRALSEKEIQELYGHPVIDDITFNECISELCTSVIGVTAHDPAGGTLYYIWEPLDGGTIMGSGPDVQFDPPGPSSPPVCNPYRIHIIVTSGATGLSTSETISIYVTLPGDFNKDGDVDGSDLAIFAADFGRTNCDQGEPCEGDFNNDGDVDGSDLAIFASRFGRTDGCACP